MEKEKCNSKKLGNVFLLSFCITATFSKKIYHLDEKVSIYELAAVCPHCKIWNVCELMYTNNCKITVTL